MERNIYQRLSAVMNAVSYVQKEDKKVNNQYTFVSHDAVTAKVRPHLIENGIVMITDVKEVKQDGNRTEAIVTLRFVNIDKPEDQVGITCFGYGIDPQDKGPGKAVSYAVKYGILKTLCLETGDDPERASIDHQPTAKPTPAKSVARDTFDKMPADVQDYLRNVAMDVIALMNKQDIAGAVTFIDNEGLDADSKVGLWSLLDSKHRSAIKAHQDSLKQPMKEAA